MLLSIKLKNQVARIAPGLQAAKLSNTVVNGQKRGCSGFFVNPDNGRVVYVDTEESCYEPLRGKALVRYAKDASDYRGECNEFVPVERTAETICKMLA